jgi:carboxypeptidase C (cathepsin A)
MYCIFVLRQVRNAGHMVPLSQPPWAQQMIEDFTAGNI